MVSHTKKLGLLGLMLLYAIHLISYDYKTLSLFSPTDYGTYDMTVLIISYHKTGHDLQMDLINFIAKEFPHLKLTEKKDKSIVRRRFLPGEARCARLHLKSSTIAVQHAPDLFCSPKHLARMLIEGGDYRSHYDKGTKIIHLVRNPFYQAVSNYRYHAQEEVPDREKWVIEQNPCQVRYGKDGTGPHYADYVLPAMNETQVFPIGRRIVTRQEFDEVEKDCLSLYQTKKGFKDANFHDHLVGLGPDEGLRLATAELIVQGFQNGGDILRMGHNVIRLKQVENFVKKIKYFQEKEKKLHVYTASLDDFLAQPATSFQNVLDFLFDETSSVPQRRKVAVSKQYEEYFLGKVSGSSHITWGKFPHKKDQIMYLRKDPVYGPVLRKVEFVVNGALNETKTRIEEKNQIGSSAQ